MMGRDPVPPFSLVGTQEYPTYFSTEDYLEHLVDVINRAHAAVRRNIKQETTRQIEYRGRTESVWKPEDFKEKTFAHTSKGPYRVICHLGHLQYEISLIANPRIMSARVERLFHVSACSGCLPELNAEGPNELQPGEAFNVTAPVVTHLWTPASEEQTLCCCWWALKRKLSHLAYTAPVNSHYLCQ